MAHAVSPKTTSEHQASVTKSIHLTSTSPAAKAKSRHDEHGTAVENAAIKKQIESYLAQGEQADAAGQWETAKGYYTYVLDRQKHLYPARDPRLLPTTGHIMDCLEHLNNKEQVFVYLKDVLASINGQKSRAYRVISQDKDAAEIYRAFGAGCMEAAKVETDERDKTEYYSWAADFYRASFGQWSGPQTGPKYTHMVANYLYALNRSGQEAQAKEVERQLGTKVMEQIREARRTRRAEKIEGSKVGHHNF